MNLLNNLSREALMDGMMPVVRDASKRFDSATKLIAFFFPKRFTILYILSIKTSLREMGA